MNTHDWAGERGERWHAELDALEAMLAPVNAPLLAALGLETPQRIADIGCGGGGATQSLVDAAAEGSEVIGFDLSPTLTRAAAQRVPSAHFIAGDVVAHPTPDPRFDRLASRFGVMFFEEAQRAFARLRTWLAPRGSVAFAVWGPPEANPWISCVAEAVAAFVEPPPTDPHGPGPFRYRAPDALPTLLEVAGFEAAEAQIWTGTIPVGGGLGPEEAADFACRAFSRFEALLAAASPDARARVRQTLTRIFEDHLEMGQVWMPASVNIVTAQVGKIGQASQGAR